MKDGFEVETLSEELKKLAKGSEDKVSRSTVRRWMILHWVKIATYLKGKLIKKIPGEVKHAKIETVTLFVISVIHNFLNYRIINDLGLSTDEANTKFDQVLTKNIGKITANFKEELDHVQKLKGEVTINVKDDAGFICVLACLKVTSDKDDIIYNMDLKERRFFAIVKREHSYIKYEKGHSIDDIKKKYPDTNVEVIGIANDVSEDEIVVFDGIDDFYRALPADMSYGIREMEKSGEFTLLTVSDQKWFTGDQISFYDVRESNIKDYQKAADNAALHAIHNILTKEVIDGIEASDNTTTMSNSFIVWDGHPSTFKMGAESNFQLLNLRHIDYDQTVTRAIKETNWTSEFINSLILISTGDNMFNITGSMDKLRQGLTKDQKSLRDAETVYPEIVRKEPTDRQVCVLTNGDVNITNKTAKSMRDGAGSITVNGSHSMKRRIVITKIVTKSVAFIRLTPEHSHTSSSYHIIKELKMPALQESYEEEESTFNHIFFITEDLVEKAAKRVLVENVTTIGPNSTISSVVNTKDLTAAGFGTVPPLEIMTRDDTQVKLASESFAPFTINEARYHINSGCVNGSELDNSSVIKVYGKGQLHKQTMEAILVETLNDMSLVVHKTSFEVVQEYKPLQYQTLNDTINNCADVFPTSILRSNHYEVLLKIPRAEIHELIYTYKVVQLSNVANVAYNTIAQLIIESLTYNPYFYVMLSMKYDIDSRFSNEITAVWDVYLLALKDYSSVEKLIIHHFVLNRSQQKLTDDKSTLRQTEKDLQAEKKSLIDGYKSKQNYYTEAIRKLETDIDSGVIDVNDGFEDSHLTSKKDKGAIDKLTSENASLKDAFEKATEELKASKANKEADGDKKNKKADK